MVGISRSGVALCDLNPVVGTEQAGIRPVVVLQIDRANIASPHTIIAPFTTKFRRRLLPSHVFIPASVGGLSQDSVLLCEQIRVIDKSRLIKILGRVLKPSQAPHPQFWGLANKLQSPPELEDLGGKSVSNEAARSFKTLPRQFRC